MNEDALRRVVRDIIAQQMGTAVAAPPVRQPAAARPAGGARPPIDPPDPEVPLGPWQQHVSHRRLLVSPGGPGTPCMIEPAVGCTHCGFCQSFGN